MIGVSGCLFKKKQFISFLHQGAPPIIESIWYRGTEMRSRALTCPQRERERYVFILFYRCWPCHTLRGQAVELLLNSKLEGNLEGNQNGINLCIIINTIFEAVDESAVLNCSQDATMK
jgi:hypothetical protein